MKERYNIMSKIQLIHGDCLEEMDKLIKQGVKIDAVITDPPYGTTACKWDSIIPLDPMWEQLKRVIKPNGAIVLFGSEPFSSALRMSNIKSYKYDLYWKKEKPTNFFQLKRRFGKVTENIIVFL
jgi:site-specific DNA-methyltransferase (adenine-specific)